MKNWLTQIKKGYLELCVLSVIKGLGRVYGFQLLSELKTLEIETKEGTLYPLLNRMTKDGLLSSTWQTNEIKGHPRKFYSLTKKGRTSLELMQTEFEAMNLTYLNIKNLSEKES